MQAQVAAHGATAAEPEPTGKGKKRKKDAVALPADVMPEMPGDDPAARLGEAADHAPPAHA